MKLAARKLPLTARSWIFPRDPQFAAKAGRALDLYARIFDAKRLRPDEYVICADEKTQLQALGFTRHDLDRVLAKITPQPEPLTLAA